MRSLPLPAALATLLAAATLAVVAPGASAGVTGSFSVTSTSTQPSGVGASASWNLAGALLPARAMAAVLGPAVQVAPDQDTDSRYVAATLQSALQATWTSPCQDPAAAGTVVHATDGIATPGAAFEVSVVLDQLRGRGTAHVGPAESPSPANVGSLFAPGLVARHDDDRCVDPAVSTPVVVPVLAHAGATLLPDDVTTWADDHAWALHRVGSGATFTGGGTAVRQSLVGATETMVTSVTVSGTGASLHASCTLPTVRDLRGARTFAAARAIVVRAGFAGPRNGGARHTRAAAAGRWYLREGVGNTSPQPCGSGARMHLDRSLGR